jgi:hypothetical protein
MIKMPIVDFHKTRRMYCIHNGKILLAPENSPLSHSEWFAKLGLDVRKAIRESVRGFVDERGLFFYKGEDFKVDLETEKTFLRHLPKLQAKLKLPDKTEIYGGLTKTKQTKYPPKKKYGTIKQNL